MSAETRGPRPPDGMVAVGQDEFFALLSSEPRDVMPVHIEPEWTTWETPSRYLWGWSAPGWRNSGAHAPTYAVASEVTARTSNQGDEG